MAQDYSLHSKQTLDGLDCLRVVAMLLVTLQHVFMLVDRRDWACINGVWLGQLGVAIFFGLSGYFAAISRKQPVPWLVHRFRRLFPAFWIVMLASFALSAASGHRGFTLGQFVSQMLGIGLFTHPNTLVNQSTWFISILLITYLGLFLFRYWNVVVIGSLLIVPCLIIWISTQQNIWLCQRVLPFFVAVAVVVVVPAQLRPRMFSVAGLALQIAGIWKPAFNCAGISMLLIGVTLAVPMKSRLMVVLAKYSYEYFLVHGIFLAGMDKLFPTQPLLAIGLGLLLSVAASVGLYHLVRWLQDRISKSNSHFVPAERVQNDEPTYCSTTPTSTS